MKYIVISYQLKLIKMRDELATLNDGAYPFLAAPPSTCAGTIIEKKYFNYWIKLVVLEQI